MEEMRKINRMARIVQGISFGVIVLSFFSFMTLGDMAALGILGFIGGFILLLVSSKYEGKVHGMYKEKYIRPLLNKYLDNVEYSPNKGFEKEMVYEAQLYSRGNRYHSNDLVKATYKGIPLLMSDVTIKQVTNNGKTTTTTEYFKGKWIIAKFPKAIHGMVKVREKEGIFGGDGTGLFSNLKKIETESLEFNEVFGVRSVDEVEAFYVLTPHFMQTLLEIEQKVEGTVGFAFIGNQIHLGLYTHKDNFEITWSDEYDEHLVHKHEQELFLITQLLDTLYENQRLFGGNE